MGHILIVDDQAFFRDLLREDLTDEGHRVTCIGQALEVYRALDESHFDLVLLDLYLNGFEGFDLFGDIKKRNPRLPILIFSAYDSFRDDPRVEKADGYVIKDIDLVEIKKEIRGLLNRQDRPVM